MAEWPVLSHYDSAHVGEIALPIGGIGTGFFCLGGRGQLTDWQLMSRPNRGWRPRYGHLLLRTEESSVGTPVKLRVMEADLSSGLSGDSGATGTLAGIPRFRDASFEASYPFGRVRLSDPDTPVQVSIEAFNPLVPRDTDASSLPMALLSLTLKNRTQSELKASVTLLLTNFIGSDGIVGDLKGNLNERAESHGWKGLRYTRSSDEKTARNGDLSVLCDAGDVRIARRWPFRGRPWNGETLGMIDSLIDTGYLPDEEPDSPCPPSSDESWDGSLSAAVTLEPGRSRTVRLLFTWSFPYRNLAEEGWWSGLPGQDPIERNFYASRFNDALDVADQVIPRLDDLRSRTASFVRSVIDRSAPHAMKEAALFNLTALRTHTSFRLGDGTFVGFEGCNATSGCCHGSCTHVWNYEEATIRLFPDLHRSMLESHLEHGITERGAQRFRLSLPILHPTWNGAAADGQMGVIVRTYEQYLADSDADGEAWIKKQYPRIKAMMEFAWTPGGWDADRDGVMEGSQHNTYDVEFFGPNPMCTVWYLAALAATAKIADIAGDPGFSGTCRDLFKKGSDAVDRHLFNGRYYIQRFEAPKEPVADMTSLSGEDRSPSPRFQVGNGCLIDQLVGQYKANRVGLGDLLDSLHLRAAVESIFRYNFRENFRDHYNNMRTFATADESGTLICSYPDEGRPAQPFPYWSECMTGFEYQLAVLLLDYGFRSEATKVAQAVRSRHDGARRNPFNEPECGSYYARSMASWALLDAWDRSRPSPERIPG